MKYLFSALRILIGVSIVLVFYPYATVYAIAAAIILLVVYFLLKYTQKK